MLLAPATIKHGTINPQDITAVSCSFGLVIGAGSLRSYRGVDLTPGSFAPNSIIRNVTAVFGETAQVRGTEHRFIPCELRGKIGEYDSFGRSYTAPSIGVVKHLQYTLRTNQAAYPINVENVTGTGFLPGVPDFVIDELDDYEDCGDKVWIPTANPAKGQPNLKNTPGPFTAEDIVLSQHAATIRVDDNLSLSARVEPVATEPQDVVWISYDPAVATVNNSGQVKAVAKGTAIVAALTPAGRFVDNATITVTAK